MKVMSKIKHIIFGEPRSTGENIIDKEPSFKTCQPDERINFNDWAKNLNVSSRVDKVRELISNQYV
jgi:hypothetical protein